MRLTQGIVGSIKARVIHCPSQAIGLREPIPGRVCLASSLGIRFPTR
jgi:hypothetical protein